MSETELTRLLSSVLQSLFGETFQTLNMVEPPAGWMCWEVPERKLEVDREISKRIAGDLRKHRVRDREDLLKEGIRCPYYYTRVKIYEAFVIGLERKCRFEEYREREAKIIDRFIDDTEKLNESLDLVFGNERGAEYLQIFLGDPFKDLEDYDLGITTDQPMYNVSTEYNRVTYFQMRELIEKLQSEANARKKEIVKSGGIGNVFERAMVTKFAQVWKTLIGCNPAEWNKEFVAFVDACIVSAGQDCDINITMSEIRKTREAQKAAFAQPAWDLGDSATELPGSLTLMPTTGKITNLSVDLAKAMVDTCSDLADETIDGRNSDDSTENTR